MSGTTHNSCPHPQPGGSAARLEGSIGGRPERAVFGRPVRLGSNLSRGEGRHGRWWFSGRLKMGVFESGSGAQWLRTHLFSREYFDTLMLLANAACKLLVRSSALDRGSSTTSCCRCRASQGSDHRVEGGGSSYPESILEITQTKAATDVKSPELLAFKLGNQRFHTQNDGFSCRCSPILGEEGDFTSRTFAM